MSLKRSFTVAYGAQGYGDDVNPPKRATSSYQADFRTGGRVQAQYDYGQSMSFESGPPQMGMVEDHGGRLPATSNRLMAMPGPTHEPDYGGYSYGYDQSGGFDAETAYSQDSSYAQPVGAYNAGGRYDQSYSYEDHSFQHQQSDWSYDQSGGEDYYGDSSLTWFGRSGPGSGQGQLKGAGRGGWPQRGAVGRGNQGPGQARGRGRSQGQVGGRGQDQGQVGGRGQGLTFAFGGQGGRGQGRGQSWNSQTVNATGKQRGRGIGNFGSSSGAYNHGTNSFEGQNMRFSFSQQHNQGYNYTQNRGRGQGNLGNHGFARGGQGVNRGGQSGRGNQRGRGVGVGRGATASQVKSISENIMGMVKGGQKGRDKGKGQAGRGRGGAPGKPSSLMDLVDTALQRKLGSSKSSSSEEANRLAQFLGFFSTCPDRVNSIQTIGNALTASRLNLQVDFDAEELMFVTKPLFTGVLQIGGFFLTRGLGLSKKAVKHDCFHRAVEMLRTKNVDEIQQLEDCGKEALKEEVQRQSEVDFESFKSFLSQKQAAEMETSEKIRTAAVSESQVAERNFPLSDKMMMLKKEIEKLGLDESAAKTMASRFDVLCFKMGISVVALFRAVQSTQARQFNTQPFKGDPDVELICEIYYDTVQVGRGQGRPRREAQVAAYSNIHARLMSEPISEIVQGPKLPTQPESLSDYFEVIYKGAKPQEGNNHQCLVSLRAYPPDLTKPVDDMVIMEMKGESIEENAYKILEFSASKNGMLLEWKQLDKSATADGFRCEITLNRQKTVVGMGQSKPKSRNAASAMILMEMYQTQDVVCFCNKDDFAKAIPFSDLVKRAEELKTEGPAKLHRVECTWPDHSNKTADSEQYSNREEFLTTCQEWLNNPLRLWLEDAVVEKMEAYQKKVTLEELIIGPGTSGGMRKFCYAAARACMLSAPTVRLNANKEMYIMVHHKGVTPQEIVKILHVCKNSSGRYTLVRANKPLSVTQQAQFVRSFPEEWMTRARAQQEAEKLKREEGAA